VENLTTFEKEKEMSEGSKARELDPGDGFCDVAVKVKHSANPEHIVYAQKTGPDGPPL
jgi:hypothetical protein